LAKTLDRYGRFAQQMSFKLDTVLSSLGVFTAVAYVLGWLQSFYYFDTFGIRLASVELSMQDHLLNSWFVIENLSFFLILAWVVSKTPRWWTLLIGAAYFLIPIAAHYAFFFPNWIGANFLIEYRHTLLKFIPFGVLGVVMFFDWLRGTRPAGHAIDLSWPYGKGMFVLFLIVVSAWSVSMAKHFGSFDANFELRYPDRMLSRVALHTAPDDPLEELATSDRLYLIHATPRQLFVWDAAGFVFGKADQKVMVYVIQRDQIRSFETIKPFQIQRGNLIF
jgi:hypothetical protein